MNIEEIKAELVKLRREIKHHNKKYYDDDAPEIFGNSRRNLYDEEKF